MTEIRVNTDDLKRTSQGLMGVASEFAGTQSQVSSVASSVGNAYDGQLKYALEQIVGAVNQSDPRLQIRATDLGEELLTRATGFDAANEAGRGAVLGVSTEYTNFIDTSKLSFLSLLKKLKNLGVSIWNLGGLTIGGFLSLIFVSEKPAIHTPFPETHSPIAVPAESTNSKNTPEKQTGFGKLMEEAEQEKQRVKEEECGVDVPLQSQQGLKLNGQPTEYGCTPTSTSMILDYWHNKESKNNTLTAQKLVEINVKQGKFSRTGMSASNIHDEVTNLGYSLVEDHMNSDIDGLKNAVAQGPVIAIVKLGIRPTGTNHAVVVKGISLDNQVQINDPWDGQSHTYSWDIISKSWGADYGKDVPKNNFVVIRP